MKYSTQRELVEGLRAMADFIETHIELPLDDDAGIKLNEWLYDDYPPNAPDSETAREKLAKVAKTLGKSEKVFTGSYFDLTKKFGPRVTLEYTVGRESVCRRVVTGTKVVPAINRPERIEEVVEWVCDEPILAG